MQRTLLLWIVLFGICSACNKKKPIAPAPVSSEKAIYTFEFNTGANNIARNVTGKVVNDTIFLKLPHEASLTSLTPSIIFKGKSISPEAKTPQNFSVPVKYTVTAADGSTKQYTVMASIGSNVMKITSFAFKAPDNEGLKKDIIGTIMNDTVFLYVPAAAGLNSLRPSITYEGDHIYPNKDQAMDFSTPASYTVFAEDGSQKTYTVLASNNKSIFMGCYDGYVYALNAASLKVKWKYKTQQQPGTPTYADGVVYVPDAIGYLYAIDAETGALKWQFFRSGTFAIPVVDNGVLYASIATSTLSRGILYAINAKTGSVLWEKTIQSLSYATVCSPIVNNGLVIVTITLGGVYAFEASTGLLKWRHIRGNELMYAKPLLVNGVLYYGEETYDMAAVDLTTGTLLSTKRVRPSACTAFCIDGNIIYNANRTGIGGFNIKDTSQYWRYTISSYSSSYCSPVAANGLVYAYDSYRLYAINLSAGREQWHYDVSSSATVLSASVNYANSLLYFNAANFLYVMNPLSGSIKASYVTNANMTELCIVDAEDNVFNAMNSGARNK